MKTLGWGELILLLVTLWARLSRSRAISEQREHVGLHEESLLQSLRELPDSTQQQSAAVPPCKSTKTNLRQRKSELPCDIAADVPRRYRALHSEKTGSPARKAEFVIISNGQWCLLDANGNYGLQMGEKVNLSFLYQIEAVAGTTETQIKGLLNEVEIVLLESILPVFFPECEGPSKSSSRADHSGYIGMSSNPSDFVLRGFSCSSANEPCFVINGSMTAYIKGIDPVSAETEMSKAIYRAMESGTTEENITEINKLSLLDDSLNLATLPTSNAPTTQFYFSQTPYPTIAATTDRPSLEPAPSTATTEPSETGSIDSTQVEGVLATELANPTALLKPESSTPTPVNSQPSQKEFDYGGYDNKSALEKIPVWVWAIAALALCVCCTYTDLDEDEEVTDVHRTLHAQERRGLAALQENHDKNKEAQDSEAFSTREYQYVRKLYRQ